MDILCVFNVLIYLNSFIYSVSQAKCMCRLMLEGPLLLSRHQKFRKFYINHHNDMLCKVVGNSLTEWYDLFCFMHLPCVFSVLIIEKKTNMAISLSPIVQGQRPTLHVGTIPISVT
jgi:hypothetical protein